MNDHAKRVAAFLKPPVRTLLSLSLGFGVALIALWVGLSPGQTAEVSSQEQALYEKFLQWDWNQPSAPQTIPDWFLTNRVHVHTRFPLHLADKPIFREATASLKALGADVITRHVKSGSEDPWWPSAIPTRPDGSPLLNRDRTIGNLLLPAGRNLVKEMIDDTHAQGMRFIAYHWTMSDATLAKRNPTWLCRKPDGSPISSNRGDFLDWSSPYREAVRQRLTELAAMGADGFYFDENHMPREGCWGSALAQAFQAETGLAPPAKIPPQKMNDEDPAYRLFLAFQAREVEKTFTYWRDSVHQRYPNVVFVISTTALPALVNERMTTNLARIADSPKNEYRLALSPYFNYFFAFQKAGMAPPDTDIRMAFSWVLLRDSAEGRPPHIWTKAFGDPQNALGFASSLLTYGAIANIDAPEFLLKPPLDRQNDQVAGIQSALALGQKISPYLLNTRPVRWAAVHFSETSRYRRQNKPAKAWREVLWPTVGAFTTFSRERLPVGIVNDYQLEKGSLDGYSLLFLPNPNELSPQQRQSVAAFTQRGGIVIPNNPDWPWANREKTPKALAALKQILDRYRAAAPVQAVGGPANLHVVAHQGANASQLRVAITTDFSWVRFKHEKNQRKNQPNSQVELGKPPEDEDSDTEPDPLPSQGSPSGGSVAGVRLKFATQRIPTQVMEVVSGKLLTPRPIPGGFEVDVPEFSVMALVVTQ